MSPDALNLFGHVAYASVALGMLLLAWKNRWGWMFRLAGEIGWVAVGLALGMSSLWTWGLVFIVADLYGFREWSRAQARESSGAPQEDDGGRVPWPAPPLGAASLAKGLTGHPRGSAAEAANALFVTVQRGPEGGSSRFPPRPPIRPGKESTS